MERGASSRNLGSPARRDGSGNSDTEGAVAMTIVELGLLLPSACQVSVKHIDVANIASRATRNLRIIGGMFILCDIRIEGMGNC